MAGINFFDTNECAWKDVEARIDGVVVTKLTGIRYKTARDKEAIYGPGDEPLSIQSGNKSYEGELRLLKGNLDALNLAAIAAKGTDITDIAFDLTVTFQPSGNRPLVTRVIIDVEVKEFEESLMQGDKKMEITLPFIALRIR